MRFAVSDEQRQFAASLHDLLAGADTPAAARAWGEGRHEAGRKLFRGLADLGVPALLIDERHGGLQAEAADLVVAFEVLGYHVVPGPLIESAVVVPAALAGGDLARKWLPPLASGTALATVLAPPEVPLALDADIAELTLELRDGAAWEVRAGSLEPVPSIDPARRLFRVADERIPAGAAAPRAFDLGVLAASAQLLGAGQWLLDEATAYARQRHQYGKPIGQYQAVKHLLADVVTQVELARPLVHGAAVAAQEGSATLARDVSAAKVKAGEAAYLAARTALQVHGAIGYTAEHDLGLRLVKVRALLGAWGDAAFHRARVLKHLAGQR
ncbi:acyl-CoA dehydrogenase family protein [Amycolatopsis alkalitolerans]|uniref:Acyl-CoA dehydrogenase n=1 Tax=Amycolatopsis alkalitolerans TaxID=2547244 RepID=A0A5C4LYV9_9PSEU|nr:acyl-CoA dehydrogenase family protein [Amycolatopsis alkalitolerans]TNC24931.1 acyl-CoA dehydrogenase [Amycolatopsis alkalitolerans]